MVIVLSANKERPLVGHVHEHTLKLLVTLVHEDNAFVVSSAAKRSPRERDSGAKTSPAVDGVDRGPLRVGQGVAAEGP